VERNTKKIQVSSQHLLAKSLEIVVGHMKCVPSQILYQYDVYIPRNLIFYNPGLST